MLWLVNLWLEFNMYNHHSRTETSGAIAKKYSRNRRKTARKVSKGWLDVAKTLV